MPHDESSYQRQDDKSYEYLVNGASKVMHSKLADCHMNCDFFCEQIMEMKQNSTSYFIITTGLDISNCFRALLTVASQKKPHKIMILTTKQADSGRELQCHLNSRIRTMAGLEMLPHILLDSFTINKTNKGHVTQTNCYNNFI